MLWTNVVVTWVKAYLVKTIVGKWGVTEKVLASLFILKVH
jgi:hypothetical protein